MKALVLSNLHLHEYLPQFYLDVSILREAIYLKMSKTLALSKPVTKNPHRVQLQQKAIDEFISRFSESPRNLHANTCPSRPKANTFSKDIGKAARPKEGIQRMERAE